MHNNKIILQSGTGLKKREEGGDLLPGAAIRRIEEISEKMSPGAERFPPSLRPFFYFPGRIMISHFLPCLIGRNGSAGPLLKNVLRRRNHRQ